MLKKIAKNKYSNMLRQIILEIKSSRIIAARRVNTTMIQMYWNIGKKLSQEGIEKGYGARVVEELSADLKAEFPNLSGFSPSNLWEMKRFFEFYCNADIKLQRSVGVLPWRHNILILNKIKNIDEARYYIENAVEQGWTRDILLNFIKANAYANSKILLKVNIIGYYLSKIVLEAVSWRFTPTG